MPKVAIHCKASKPDGMGHIYRQINLANELRKQGWEISFYIPHFAPAADLLNRSKFTPTLIKSEVLISQYFNEFFDLIILDIQNTAEPLICSIKQFSHRIASFEDLGPGRDLVDLLIDCNLDQSESKKLPLGTKTLFGADYSVLHPDFALYHKKSREFNATLQSLLITMGATDPKGLTLPLTQLLLKENKNLKLTVLTGHNMTSSSQFDKLASQFESLSLPGPVSNMAKTLWEHEMVVCAGGVTLHEAIAVGTPALVINQTEHQQSKAHFVEKSGAAINLGMGDKYDTKKLLMGLNSGKTQLTSMSLKGKKIIDGRGLFRITEAITELIKE